MTDRGRERRARPAASFRALTCLTDEIRGGTGACGARAPGNKNRTERNQAISIPTLEIAINLLCKSYGHQQISLLSCVGMRRLTARLSGITPIDASRIPNTGGLSDPPDTNHHPGATHHNSHKVRLLTFGFGDPASWKRIDLASQPRKAVAEFTFRPLESVALRNPPAHRSRRLVEEPGHVAHAKSEPAHSKRREHTPI